MSRAVWTEVKVQPRQFKLYQVKQQVELNFSMREFKASIALADHLKLPLELSFNQGGSPLVIKVECPAMVAEIYIATSPPSEEEEKSQSRSIRESVSRSIPEVNGQIEEQQSNWTAQGQEESATLLDDELQREVYRQESEVVYSGRSAVEDFRGPLQSTAPLGGPANGIVEADVDHERQSSTLDAGRNSRSRSKERDDTLFLGHSSSQERSHDSAMNTRMDRALEEASEAAEAEEEQREQSQAVPIRDADESMSDIMNGSNDVHQARKELQRESSTDVHQTRGELHREESETIREEPGYSVSDEEEEIPSTQHESTFKRPKVS